MSKTSNALANILVVSTLVMSPGLLRAAPALMGSGDHMTTSPYFLKAAVPCSVKPTYTLTTPFVGTWSAAAPGAWQGSFKATGPAIWSGGTSGTTEFDFTTLPGKSLPSTTQFTFHDFDGTGEIMTLVPTSSSLPLAPVPPWLTLPISVYEDGTQEPGHPQEWMPGWSYNPMTATYTIDGTKAEIGLHNPAINFTLTSRYALKGLRLSKPSATEFWIAASCVSPRGDPTPADNEPHILNKPYVPRSDLVPSVAPRYTGDDPRLGNWSAPAPGPWAGVFTASGPPIWSGSTAGTTMFDFTSLPEGSLPPGTEFTFVDFDGQTEQIVLTPSAASVPPAPVPHWLSPPIAVFEEGSQDPGHDLSLMPGWSYDAATGSYTIDGSTVNTAINPSIGFKLVNLSPIKALSVTKPGSTQFSIDAPFDSQAVPALPRVVGATGLFALLLGCALLALRRVATSFTKRQ